MRAVTPSAPTFRRALAVALAAALANVVPVARAADSTAMQRGTVGGREYRVFAPSDLSQAAPMVVGLHGCWQTPEDFAAGTRLNVAAARRGFVVVYPVQSRRDNPSRCWNWFEPANQARGKGEIAEIAAIVTDVTKQRRIQPSRIVAIGLSAGAFMAVNLACAMPETFRGIGAAAGGPYRCGIGVQGALTCMLGQRLDPEASATACTAAGGPRTRELHASLWAGTVDTVVSVADFDALRTMLARVTGSHAGTSEDHDGATSTVYRTADGRPVIEAWLVEGMGHAWSGGDARGTHTFPPGPDATTHMVDFLLPELTRTGATTSP